MESLGNGLPWLNHDARHCERYLRQRVTGWHPLQLAALAEPIKALLSGVNYFFALTTIISPDQRQLLFDS
jgi:hypothetical protein